MNREKRKKIYKKKSPEHELKKHKTDALTKAREIRLIVEPLCEAEGMELVHVEYQRETGGRVLRIYIDGPGGVTLDDCVGISRQLSDLLDVSSEGSGEENEPYSLEVSSPGPERPLGKESDFERFKGSMAKIKTAPSDGTDNSRPQKQKTYKGVLLGISGTPQISGQISEQNSQSSEIFVNLLVSKETVLIPFREIIRARLVGQ
ncbi:MAG: ribosome maturation factor RimP [Desulfobacterales bacterium]|nr:ribosome maturation factor RimP [Desulfobacterales bacterium]